MGKVNAYDSHIIEGEICIVCDPSVQPTEGIIYGVSLDGTYAEVIGYAGSATNVRIADEYMGLPVKCGFIKDSWRKFADLYSFRRV